MESQKLQNIYRFLEQKTDEPASGGPQITGRQTTGTGTTTTTVKGQPAATQHNTQGWTGVPHGKLQINDLVFTVPPEHIQIHQQYENLELDLLRSSTDSVVRSGHGEYHLNLTLTFPDRDSINNSMLPLMQQLDKTPFCLIENELIRRTIFPGSIDPDTGQRYPMAPNMAFTLIQLTVGTIEQQPGALQLQLHLVLFNYSPFSRRFTFKRNWSSNTTSAPTNRDEASQSIANWELDQQETFNPQESVAWRAFWQHGWRREERLLYSDCSNDFALRFTLISKRGDQIVPYRAVWRPRLMTPVFITATYTNRIARLPVLNWVYATHQYTGSSNFVIQAVFVCQDSARRELEFLQYLINTYQEQVLDFRRMTKEWQPVITNDIARICGIQQVAVNSLTVDTMPGHPDALKVILTLIQYAPPEKEELRPVSSPYQLDSILQQALNLLLDLGRQQGFLELNKETVTTFDTNVPGFPIFGDQEWVWRAKISDYFTSNPVYLAITRPYGNTGESLLQLLDRRPNKRLPIPLLPGDDAGALNQYYNSLRTLLQRVLEGPLASVPQFTDIRAALYKQKGNIKELLCYPDLDLPPHPATGRIADTNPDCYFFNESDSRPAKNSKVIQHCLDVIQQSYSTVKRTTKGSGGIGWDYQDKHINAAPQVPTVNSTTIRPTSQYRPRQAQYAEAISEASRRTGVPEALIEAMIMAESTNRQDAVSPKGAMGLMQIMPGTAEELATKLGVTKEQVLTDPYWNIIAGATYLKEQYDRFGSWDLALAAYNAGPGAVINAGNAIPNIPETKNYVSKVTSLYNTYSSTPTTSPTSTTTLNYIMPTSGTVTSTFNDSRSGGRLHSGIDIAAPAGTPIVAPTTLTVTMNKYSNSGGWLLWATDQNGYVHQFHHLQEQSPIAVGQTIPQGTVLGYVGNTGAASTGPHLDWKIKVPPETPGAQYNGVNGYYLPIEQVFNLKKGQKVVAGQSIQGSTALAQNRPAPIIMPATSASTTSGGDKGGDTTVDNGMNTTERSFDAWIHNPERDSENASASSVQLTKPKLAYAPTHDTSYYGPIMASIEGQTLSPSQTYNQRVSPSAAQEIFKAFVENDEENVLSMRRAYPTYALYFIDEMRSGSVVFTNAYSWGAVQEIRLVRSRKNPVDTLVITLGNAKGELMTKQMNTLNSIKDDERVISFNRQIIKEGTAVKLKLGYDNDPDKLPLVFTGKVTEIEDQNSTLVTIVCQSFAVEFFQREIGDDPNSSMGWFNSDTREILSILLTMPELSHFGRWAPNQSVQSGEGGLWHGSVWRYFFRFFPNPADNNIFAPTEGLLNNVWHYMNTGMWRDSAVPFQWLRFVPFRQTAWEIVEEMTLRHPGYIAAVVPYEGVGSHMATLFFGLPSQMYFWRAPDIHEHITLRYDNPKTSTQAKIMARRMKPFRNYFYVDSEHHIIHNGIRTTARDTYNAVTVEYVQKATEAFRTGNNDKGKVPDPSAFFTSGSVSMKANDAIREDYCRWFHTRERNCEGRRWALCYATSYLFRLLKDFYEGELIIVGEPAIKPYDIVMLYDSYNDMAGPIEVEQVVHIFNREQGFISIITPDLVVNTNEYLSASLIDGMRRYYTARWLSLVKRTPTPSGRVTYNDISELLNKQLTGDNEVSTTRLTPEATIRVGGDVLLGGAIVPLYYGGYLAVPISIVVAGCGLMLFNWARKAQPIRITPLIWRGRPFICGLDGFSLDTAWGLAVTGAVRAFRGFSDFLEHAATLLRQLAS